MERFEIFTICRRPPVLQTDARVSMMKIVVRETEAHKASGRRTSAPRYLGNETLLRAGAHGNTWASVGPIRAQNLKAIRALESARTTAIPIYLGPYGKTGNIIIEVRGARAQ